MRQNDLERYMRRQEQLHRVDRWLDKHSGWAWLMAILVAGLVFSAAMLLKEVLGVIGGK
jgi:hypothetical protein